MLAPMELRPLSAGDATAIHESLLGDPEVAHWFRTEGPFTLAECEEMVTRKLAHRDAHGFGWSLAWEDGECVGWSCAQYCIVDGAGEVEVGWAVARPYWRRGIGTRLGEVAITEISSLALSSFVAYTRPENVASRGVMTKLGMSYEKDFDLHGLAHVLYRRALDRV
jgi:[ribosomal protein S5]-alanine N-acetyltransferase